ncbi:hypothetical protein MRB53_012529 [Persea americana]|uniref:Uncharacterized protein n=1 Tax=Persea americana TaxID=3435 RepID=A0ACC2LXP6_PERAE|nr:hypothetical protein MRB53_012529 [Persea americana]
MNKISLVEDQRLKNDCGSHTRINRLVALTEDVASVGDHSAARLLLSVLVHKSQQVAWLFSLCKQTKGKPSFFMLYFRASLSLARVDERGGDGRRGDVDERYGWTLSAGANLLFSFFNDKDG